MPSSRIEKKRQNVDNTYVLDSYALLAHLEGGDGGEKVAEILKKAQTGKHALYMSVINLGEVYYITMRERGADKAEEVLVLIEQLPIKIVEVDRDLTKEAAKLKAKHPVAYADCFASALAIKKNIKLITGDPEFKKLEKEVKIMWI